MNKKYVITNGEFYISQKLNNITNDINQAKIFNDISSANASYKNSVSKVIKKMNYKVQPIDLNSELYEECDSDCECDYNLESISNSYSLVDIEELKDLLSILSEKFSLLKRNKDFLIRQESNIDKAISDILHYIEFNNFSASDGYKLCKKLKELRLHRRKIKNELELINIINMHTCNNIANGNTNKAINELENKAYSPRVFKDLFDNRDISELLK